MRKCFYSVYVKSTENQLIVMLNSLNKTNSGIEIIVFTNDDITANFSKFIDTLDNISIAVKKVDMAAKLAAFEYFYNEGYQKAIYLDAKLVIKDHLIPMLSKGLEDAFFSGALEYPLHEHKHFRIVYEKNCAQFKQHTAISNRFINDDVLMINFDRLRASRFNLDGFIVNSDQQSFVFKDYFNKAFVDQLIIKLPNGYNAKADLIAGEFMSHISALKHNIRNDDSAILNYNSAKPPWENHKYTTSSMQIDYATYAENCKGIRGYLSKEFKAAVDKNLEREQLYMGNIKESFIKAYFKANK